MNIVNLRILDELTDNLNNIIKKFNNFVVNIDTYEDIDKLNDVKLDIVNFGLICNKLDEISSKCNFIQNNIINIVNLKIIDICENKYNLCKVLNINNDIPYDLLINNNINTEIYNIKLESKTENKQIIDNLPNLQIEEKNIMDIPVIMVDNESQINNNPLYYIKSSKEFAIKINNNLIKGNVGNIYDKKEYNKINIMKCNTLNCNILNCKFYHDNTNNNFDNNNSYIRNFMNYSWNYVKTNKLNQINYYNNKKNNRMLGSRDNIMNDLLYTNENEKDLRHSQLMHDILIYQILNNYLEN